MFDRLLDVAQRQHGVFGIEQARALGIDKKWLCGAKERGEIVTLRRGIYRLRSWPDGEDAQYVAALLASGPGSVLSHFTAAHLWGAWLAPEQVHVLVPYARRRRCPSNTIQHRSKQISFGDLIRHPQCAHPVTSPLRTALDCASRLRSHWLASVVDELTRRGLMEPDRALASLGRYACMPGVARLRLLLETSPEEIRNHDSVLESAMARLLVDSGLPAPQHHVILNTSRGPWETDFCWPELGLVLETDGAAFHGDAQKQVDRRRDAILRRELGYETLRVGWKDVQEHPNRVLARLREALQGDPSHP